MDVASGILTEQKFISDCRYRVIESSSLVPVLFRDVFSHPYIPLFHLLVNGFSVITLNFNHKSLLHENFFFKVHFSRRPETFGYHRTYCV